MNEPQTLQQVDRTYVRIGSRKLSYFAGCDYFRLASHPKVLKAVETGLRKYGLNVAASRLTTGNHELFERLESTLAAFFKTETAILVSNGYVTNLVAAQALAGKFSHVLIDEKAHPSLKDASKILGCPIETFQHRDANDVAGAVDECGPGARIILLTDGMFSHDGGIAPLKAYLKELPSDAMMLVDDAHAAGTLGQNGRGTVELENIPRNRVVQTVTLSKAFGVYGGGILATNELRARIFETSRMFVGNTPLPLPLAHAAIQSLQIVAADKRLRSRLQRNVQHVKGALAEAGLPVENSLSPILTFAPANAHEAKQIKARCLQNNIFPSLIKYPGGPDSGYFRFVISSQHSKGQLKSLVQALVG